MIEDVLELVDKLWEGDEVISTEQFHPVSGNFGKMVEVADDTAFVPSLANISAFRTGGGLVLVDTGNEVFARSNHAMVRTWTDEPLDAAVFSHGHIDHVFGVGPYEEEAAEKGWAQPTVFAHEHMPARFDRYQLTNGYNSVINQRQFQIPGLQWPMDYRYPDETYHDHHSITVGDEVFELHHDKGETDDHTWTWIPGRKVVCPGDLVIWGSPNGGNPQKVQRYPKEWAAALRKMQALRPEILLPGHGYPLLGADRVDQLLDDTATLLESLVEQTLALMNEGASLDVILHTVQAPDGLLDRPYLRPVYDEPEFIVRNLWRLYGGWYDGNPSRLKPAPDADLAAELASMVGGASTLAARAIELSAAGEHRLACHLVEFAAKAAPDDKSVAQTRADVYSARLADETSTMSKGIFNWAVKESTDRANG
ncbi:MAG TPA: alkyl sulfatase dimerization domain-containing protein [Acidimicrobiales bacterium]|nr:alkyl sulfatase dimerization domain-containing protein [Acidimicrobiales bacterium]